MDQICRRLRDFIGKINPVTLNYKEWEIKLEITQYISMKLKPNSSYTFIGSYQNFMTKNLW